MKQTNHLFLTVVSIKLHDNRNCIKTYVLSHTVCNKAQRIYTHYAFYLPCNSCKNWSHRMLPYLNNCKGNSCKHFFAFYSNGDDALTRILGHFFYYNNNAHAILPHLCHLTVRTNLHTTTPRIPSLIYGKISREQRLFLLVMRSKKKYIYTRFPSKPIKR